VAKSWRLQQVTARVVLAPLLVAALAIAPTADASGPSVTPDHDPFYTYSGSIPLGQIAPGTVVKERTVKLALGARSAPKNAQQLLYRTTGQLGQPTVTVTTVIKPAAVPIKPNIVEYLSFYDGLGSQCDPSYTLAGGTETDSATQQQAMEEGLLIDWYLSMGWVVTVPDFEGTHLDWMAGRESGFGALDGIRATESYLHVGPSTKVALSGYSGGAVAADWASELAPAYAPKVNIVGVAEGGIPVHYAHAFNYINGDKVNSSVMPGWLLGLARAYHLDLTPYLSAYGAQLVKAESQACITSVFGDYPGLTYQQLMKPQYKDLFTVPVFVRIFNDQIMGTAQGHPKAPLFMGVGNSDGTGDGVMRADDVEALAYEYCHQGVTVKFKEYQHANHQVAAAFFEPETGPFLRSRFAGVPFRGNCASIGPGNSLAPLPTP
jgi:Secretory lipase